MFVFSKVVKWSLNQSIWLHSLVTVPWKWILLEKWSILQPISSIFWRPKLAHRCVGQYSAVCRWMKRWWTGAMKVVPCGSLSAWHNPKGGFVESELGATKVEEKGEAKMRNQISTVLETIYSIGVLLEVFFESLTEHECQEGWIKWKGLEKSWIRMWWLEDGFLSKYQGAHFLGEIPMRILLMIEPCCSVSFQSELDEIA